MNLYEFFGTSAKSADISDPRDSFSNPSTQDNEKIADEVFWYILDDDAFHKEFFLPLAYKIAALQKTKKFNHDEYTKKWMPLVNKACVKYYHEHELSGDPEDVFPLDLRKGISKRLANQHHKDIESGEYTLN